MTMRVTGSLFERVPMAYRQIIEVARALLPLVVAELITPRFLCGVSPRWVGLHSFDGADLRRVGYPDAPTDCYDRWAHACYALHAPDRVQTIVFPSLDGYPDPIGTVLHEIGHMYDEATGFVVDVPATTRYSETNRFERFAEGFSTIIRPPSGEWDAYVRSERFRPFREQIGLEL